MLTEAFSILRQNSLSSTGSGLFFMALVALPLVSDQKEWRYQFVYPVYLIVFSYVWYPTYAYLWSPIIYGTSVVNLIPITVIIALVISRGCYSVKGWERVVAVAAAVFLIFYISDNVGESFYEDFYKIENVYGLPQDVVDVCDLMLSEEEQPLILVNDPDVDYFRQYSSNVKIVNVNLAGMSAVAETRSEYTQIQELMSDPGTIYMNLVGELAAECGVDYIILRVDAYQSVNYADELYYTLYEVIGDYLVFKVKA